MKRLTSIDALRGFDMFFIVGGSGLLCALARVLFGEGAVGFCEQMEHVKWEGLHLMDVIFPLFVFIAGLTFPFSYARQRERGDSNRKIHLKILRRSLLLLLLGLLYNGFLKNDLHHPSGIRYFSVLGKIGIAWGIAAVIYAHSTVRGRFLACLGGLLGYAALLWVVAPDAPAGTSPWTLDGCFPGYLDRLFTPGHLYLQDKLEPSGPFVSLFGYPTALMGMLAGDLVRAEGRMATWKTAALALVGAGLVALGWALSPVCPVIKMLWTPTYMLVCGGIGYLAFAFFHWIIDVRGWSRWCFPFTLIGMNAILIYMLGRIVDFMAIGRFFVGGLAGLCGGEIENLILWTGAVAVRLVLLYGLYRLNVFFKV